MVVISNDNIFKFDFSKNLFNKFDIVHNKLIETDLRLIEERCVTSFLGNLQS